MSCSGRSDSVLRGADDGADDAVGVSRRRSEDEGSHTWSDGQAQLIQGVRAPLRSPVPTVMAVAAVLAVALELAGLLFRLTCSDRGCSPGATALARRWDMDALGSLPRTYIAGLFLAVALVATVGAMRCARAGARPWWSMLALAGATLCLAKAYSIHSLLEVDLGSVLSETNVQLLFVVVAALGLTVVLLSGSRVRRDTRTATLTWLVLYAAAAIGLAAATNALSPLGTGVLAVATFVEETAEALAAVGLLAVVLAGVRDLAARRG